MEFEKVIFDRESVRMFNKNKPSEEQLMKILEAGRRAPTAKNVQPQKIFVLESEEALKKMDEVHRCRYKAKLVLLVCVDKEEVISVNGRSECDIDGSIVATHMMLEAFNLGVDSVWCGIFNPDEVRKVFGLEEKYEPICFLDLGFRSKLYPGSIWHKKRKPIEEMYQKL